MNLSPFVLSRKEDLIFKNKSGAGDIIFTLCTIQKQILIFGDFEIAILNQLIQWIVKFKISSLE